jgi:hypothetical protein
MAEGYIRCALNLEINCSWFAFVTLGTVFFILDTEGFYPGVTGAAGPGLFHIGHGVSGFILEIEYGVMADPAVIPVFLKMKIVTEDHRFGILKGE